MLGYTPVTWDNESGQERLPWSATKSWAALSSNEKDAAGALGYTELTWDNESGAEPQPLSAAKSWAQMTACGDGKHAANSNGPSTPVSMPMLSYNTSVSISKDAV